MVKEIKADKNISLQYISTTENPADKAGRGSFTGELRDDRIWWHGPNWLTQPQQIWPEWTGASTDKQKAEIHSEVESENRKTKVMFEDNSLLGRVLQSREGRHVVWTLNVSHPSQNFVA